MMSGGRIRFRQNASKLGRCAQEARSRPVPCQSQEVKMYRSCGYIHFDYERHLVCPEEKSEPDPVMNGGRSTAKLD